MEHDYRKNFPSSEEKSGQKRKREMKEVELFLKRVNEKVIEKKKRSYDKINEFLDMEHNNRDNQLFLDTQKRKQEEEDSKSELFRTNEKQEKMKEMPKRENNEFSDSENCHFPNEKSAQKRNTEDDVVESELSGMKEQPVGKKSRSNEDVNESLAAENDSSDNFYISKENSRQKRKHEDMEFERRKRSYEETHYILVDNIPYSLTSGLRVCNHINSNFEFSSFIINDSSYISLSRESSNMENDESTDFPMSEEKAQKPMQEALKLNQAAQMQMKGVEKQTQEIQIKKLNFPFSEEKAPKPIQEAVKRNQEAQMQMKGVEKQKQEEEIKKQEAELREQQLKQMSQKRMQLAKKLVQDRKQKTQEEKREKNYFKSDLLRRIEERAKNNERSNKTILGSFVDDISPNTVSTQHVGVNISNHTSSVVVNNDSFCRDITSPNQSNENSKDSYNNTDKNWSDGFFKNKEDKSNGWQGNESIDLNKYWPVDFSEKNLKELNRLFENELNDASEYGSYNFSEDKKDDQSYEWRGNKSSDSNDYESNDNESNDSVDGESDGWYEDDYDAVKEYEPYDFYEKNESVPDLNREYESSNTNKYQDGDYSQKIEIVQPDEFNEALEGESENNEDLKPGGQCKDTPDDVSKGEHVHFLVSNGAVPDEPLGNESNDTNAFQAGDTSECNKGEISESSVGEPPDAD